jgi:preprotein translocase subunit YajC
MGIFYGIGFALIFMIVIYLLMVRPVTQREKQHDEMVEELEPGDNVITAGGMYGQVNSIDEASVVLKVESGALVRISKGGVLKRNDALAK